MKATVLIKNAVRCKRCGSVIESKHCHDFVTCSCGDCSVDGGLDYLKRCGNLDGYEELSESKVIEFEPKYKRGNKVVFEYFIHCKQGTIQTIDTYPNSTNVYYDILVDSEPKLYKHIYEDDIIGCSDEDVPNETTKAAIAEAEKWPRKEN